MTWDGNGWRHRMSPCDLEPYLEPRMALPQIIPPAPLPGLAITPKRLATETLAVDAVVAFDPVGQMMRKVRAEDERMRRLLPPAPDGYAWTAELQTHNAEIDFARNRGTVEARIVYRLVPRE